MLQSFKLAIKSIWSNKMRSFLTMLGIIIGVSSVIILVGLVNGQMSFILESYSNLGMNRITINLTNTPSRQVTAAQMYEFYQDNKHLFKEISPMISVTGKVKYKAEKLNSARVHGVNEQYLSILAKKLTAGRFIQYSDVETRQNVCVLGYYGAEKLFGSPENALGQEVKLGGRPLTVVGVMERLDKNEKWAGGIDDVLYVPYTTAILINQNGDVDSYVMTSQDSENTEAAKASIAGMLLKTYKSQDLFHVDTMTEMIKSMNSTITMMSATLGGIAGISLLVAGVGVMNIMLVSVTERTREIGIRKSLGAKRRTIMQQFVIEAAVTSSLGGIIGIIVGSIATPLLGNLLKTKSTPSLTSILISFGVSAAIGLFFGYMPARRAAKLNPIDALKSE